ncbi:MAG: ferredoxin [bacterium]|nr:ferredoxin [bacterium]
MKAKINKELCTGDGLCVETCPEVFEMDGDTARVKINKIPEIFEGKCQEAAEGCPSEAISVEE